MYHVIRDISNSIRDISNNNKNNKNKVGSKTLPCGTPLVMLILLDKQLLMITSCCDRWSKK